MWAAQRVCDVPTSGLINRHYTSGVKALSGLISRASLKPYAFCDTGRMNLTLALLLSCEVKAEVSERMSERVSECCRRNLRSGVRRLRVLPKESTRTYLSDLVSRCVPRFGM